MDRRFRQRERLKSRKLIATLFKEGKVVKAYPVMAVFKVMKEQAGPPKAGFSVPRKRFKKAVERNKIKRRMLEAYRLQKEWLCLEGVPVAIMFIYTGKDMGSYDDVERGMKKVLKGVGTKIDTGNKDVA